MEKTNRFNAQLAHTHTFTVRECHVQSNQLRKCELYNTPHGLVQYKYTPNNALYLMDSALASKIEANNYFYCFWTYIGLSIGSNIGLAFC